MLKGGVLEVTDRRILEHECVGTVEAIGAEVETAKVGDRAFDSRRTGPRRAAGSDEAGQGRNVVHFAARRDQAEEAYDVFARAAETGALKVVLAGPEPEAASGAIIDVGQTGRRGKESRHGDRSQRGWHPRRSGESGTAARCRGG